MNLRELVALTGVAERQIRYLIAEGFVAAPSGGRAHADYGADHAAAIRRYTALRRTGLLPSAIRVLLSQGGPAPFPVAPGVTLLVEPRLLGGEQDVDALMHRLRAVLVDLVQETPDAPDSRAPDSRAQDSNADKNNKPRTPPPRRAD